MRWLTKLCVWGGVALFGVVALAAVAGSQVLPPGTDGPASDCAGEVPIVVGSDEAAQSDLYSAATLAGVIDTSCIVLAGPRDGEMDAAQVARLDAAATAGWVMGGEAAVPEAKVAGRGLKRLNGVDRWHTARLAGAIALDPDGDVAALTEATAPGEGELGGGSVIVDGAEVRLPPGLDASCAGQVPIVVAVDAAAQSDLYSAATLAGVLNTTCYVLAGARGEPMSDEQRARLEAAAGDGWIVGGEAAVPPEKVAGFELERQGGADRWATARVIGATAVAQAAAEPAETTTTTERVVRRTSGGGGGGGGSSRSGGSSRAPTRTPSPAAPAVPVPGTTSTTTTTEPMSTTTTTVPGETTTSTTAAGSGETTTTTTEPAPTGTTVPDDTTTTTTTEPESTTTTTEPQSTTTTTTMPADTTTTTTEPPRMASMFAPSVAVEVPQLDGIAGANIWTGETLEVTLAVASGADADCTGVDETLTYTVQDSGAVMLTAGSVPAMLIGTLEDGTTNCTYTVTFPAALADTVGGDFDWTMAAPAQAQVTVSEASDSATGAYTVGDVTFAPDATIAVPSGNDGAAFDVQFAGDRAACSGNPTALTHTYTVPASGTAAAPAAANSPSLIAYPSGATAASDVCEYTVTFPQNENGTEMALARQTSPSATVTGVAQAVSATYDFVPPPMPNAEADRFEIYIELVVDDRTTASQDEYLTYTYAPSHRTCWLEKTEQRVAIRTAVEGGSQDSPDFARMQSDGVTPCSYTVTFPTDEDGPWARWERYDFSNAPNKSPYTGSFSDAISPCEVGVFRCGDFGASYRRAAVSRFVPQVAISVPDMPADGFVGATFEVNFTQMGSTPANCSAADGRPVTQTYTVQAGSRVAAATGTVELLVHDPDTSAAGETCSYTATFPPAFTVRHGDGTATLLGNDGDATATISDTTLVERSYSARTPQPVGSFTPTISVSVPELEGLEGSNVWVDEEFEVTMERASGSSADCSLGATVTVTYTVQADGEVTTVDADLPATLIGTTAGGVACEYAVTFPAAPTDDDSDFGWTMTPAAATTATLSDADMATRSASAEYTVGEVTFAPDAALTVPSRSDGKRFSIDFTGTGTDCPNAALTYAVDADGSTVVLADASTALVAYPAGATAMTDVCSYTAAFPSTETDATRLALVTPASDTTATGTDQAIAATYERAAPLQGSTADAPSGYAPTFEDVSVGNRFACGLMADGAVTCWGRSRYTVTEVPPGSFQQVDAGGLHACGLKDDDTIECWGANGDQVAVPAGEEMSAFEEVVTGGIHSCGRKADGSVVCWGWDGDDAGRLMVPEGTFVSISSGVAHTCGVKDDDTVACWGSNDRGQATVPQAEATSTFKQVSAGDEHSCAIRLDDAPEGSADGTVFCWGSDAAGQSTVPAADASSTFTSVSAGYEHTCGLKTDGAVVCWGSNETGEATAPVGTFSVVDAGNRRTCAVRAGGAPDGPPGGTVTCWGYGNLERAMPPTGLFSQLSAGVAHACGVRADQTLACWGSNGPVGAPDNRAMPPTGAFSQVAAGGAHSCGVRAAAGPGGEAIGTVTCWGANDDGQSTNPTGTFSALSAGDQHTCGIRSGGSTDATVTCWGSNSQGQATVPSAETSTTFSSVSAGWAHTCAVRSTARTLVCWGANGEYQSTVPPILATTEFDDISAGGEYSCGVKRADSALICWGEDGDGQRSGAPAGSFESVSAAHHHACALRTDGAAVCWGNNSSGETDAPSGVFTAVTAGDGHSCGTRVDGTVICWGAGVAWQSVRGPVMAVSSGDKFSCGLRSGGSVFCWGDNRHGQLAAPEGAFTQVDVGPNHACGLKTDGTVACWGESRDDKTTVPDLTGPLTFTAVVAASQHSCGLVSDGTVTCWGSNNGSRTTAPDLEEGERYVQLSAGWNHTCAVKADGAAVCWGDNEGGQTSVPSLPEGQTFVSVSAGRLHSCGVKSDGAVVCWGWEGHQGAQDGRVSRVPNARFLSVTAGAEHSCGVKTDQKVTCWGSGFERQTRAPNERFVSVSGGGEHTCALKLDGSVRCWGYMNFGQVTSPAGAFGTVTGGRWHSCGVETDGTATCWGNNDHQRSRPPGLEVGETYTQLSAGRSHSCGLKADGTGACWGSNGDFNDGRVSRTPTDALTFVAAGGFNSCGVVAADGRATCWGTNSDGQSSPPSPGAGQSFTQVSAGRVHGCGLKANGAVVCWGYDPPFLDGRVRHTPSTATDLFTDLAVGVEHSCAVRQTSGAVVCWGSNASGQSTDQTGPFSAVTAGGLHTCALRSGGADDGTVFCWGDNSAGQLLAPEGTFDAIEAGTRHTCAVRSGGDADNAVVCWGAGIEWHVVTGRPPVA